MIAYKGFTKELHSYFGDDKRENCSFKPGETKTIEKSKTGRIGFHCCENPFDCLGYYSMDGNNRFFKVEASGNIDEDAGGKIACTRITLLEELTMLEFVKEGIAYMIEHPFRENWQQDYWNVKVMRDECEAKAAGHVAIARGKHPRVKGAEGSVLAMMLEDEYGISNVKLVVIKDKYANRWIGIDENREVIRLEKETYRKSEN